MIIDWKKYDDRDHVLSWFLLEAMSQANIEQFGEFESSEFEVEIKVNGIEIPIIKPMNFLQDQLDAIMEQGRVEGYAQAKLDIRDSLTKLFGIEGE